MSTQADRLIELDRTDGDESPRPPDPECCRALLDNAADITVLLDADGAVRWVSPAATRILRRSRRELVGAPTFDLIHPADRDVLATAYSTVVARGGSAGPIEYRLLEARGQWRRVEAVISNMLNDPAVGAIVMSVRVLGDQIKVVSGRRAEDRYRGLLEQSPEPVLLIDRDLVVTYASWMARRLLGAPSAGTLIGQPMRRFIPDEDAVSVERAIRGVLRSDAKSSKAQWTIVRFDGRRVEVELSAAAVVHAGHKAVQIVLRDATASQRARRQAEQARDELERDAHELRESNRELESAGAIALHDVMQPMQVVYGYLKMLEDGRASSAEEVREWSGHAFRTLHRIWALLESLATRSTADSDGVRAETVDSAALASEVLTDLAPAIDGSNASVEVDALPELVADAAQLGELMQNLIANALKFVGIGQQPHVHVSASRGERAWRFVVADNGIGIPVESLEQVFEPFEQVEQGRRYPGSGLGLYTCRRIVERHGGKIWAERADPVGTRICFTIADRPEPRRTAARG